MKYSKNLLKWLYTTIIRIRLFEEKLAEEVLAGKIKTPCHLYVGQEAIAAGVCAALKKSDYIFGTHRSHGHFLAKGGDMKALMAEIYGKSTGCSRGHGGSMHIIQTNVGIIGAQPLVAGTIPIATGAALASQIKKEKRVTVAFFGDGAVEEGIFQEVLNFAAWKKLPLILVCENNLYSSHLHIRERRPSNNIYKLGLANDIPSPRIDGNNPLKVLNTTQKAVQRAREGKGPTLIEAMTYRLRGHVGAVDKLGDQDIIDIRDPEEVKKWLQKEPVRRFENYLIKNKIFSKKVLMEIKTKAQKEVDQALLFAQKSPYPKAKEFSKYVFSK